MVMVMTSWFSQQPPQTSRAFVDSEPQPHTHVTAAPLLTVFHDDGLREPLCLTRMCDARTCSSSARGTTRVDTGTGEIDAQVYRGCLPGCTAVLLPLSFPIALTAMHIRVTTHHWARWDAPIATPVPDQQRAEETRTPHPPHTTPTVIDRRPNRVQLPTATPACHNRYGPLHTYASNCVEEVDLAGVARALLGDPSSGQCV